MKKNHNILLPVLLAIGLASCGAPAASASQPSVVTFADPLLETMVRGSIGKPQGDITLAEAQAVTRLNLSNEWQRYSSDGAAIKDIGGLESFTNLESLDLSFHAITDISPLSGLTKLTSLSLGANPITDISPLAGLTNLQVLNLSGCAAQDYSPLSGLANLQFLKLDNSTLADVSPLATLTNLRHLYLANSPVNGYAPLAEIYPNLEGKDFIVASTLLELGFVMNNETKQAYFEGQDASFTINHSKWGAPPMSWDADIIRMSKYLEGDYKLSVGYYGGINAYVFGMDKDGELMNYVYDAASGSLNIGAEHRARSEQVVRAAMDVQEGEDALLAPMRIFNDAIQNTFNMTADALYDLPLAPPGLRNLGFYPDEANAVWLYEQREGRVMNIAIHRPEWGEKDFDLRFFTPLSDEYRVVVSYHINERKFDAKADDNDQGGASFDFFIDTQEHVDTWCSNPDMTVEEYFINAYNDPGITDVYLQSVELVNQSIRDTFDMTLEELLALPAGD